MMVVREKERSRKENESRSQERCTTEHRARQSAACGNGARCVGHRNALHLPSHRTASSDQQSSSTTGKPMTIWFHHPTAFGRTLFACRLKTVRLTILQASTARANQLQHLCQALIEARAGPSFLQAPTVNRPKKTAARARPVTSCRRTELLCPSRKDARETHPGTSPISSIPFPSLTTSQQTLLHTALPSPPFHNERNTEAGFKHKVSEFQSSAQAPARHPQMH